MNWTYSAYSRVCRKSNALHCTIKRNMSAYGNGNGGFGAARNERSRAGRAQHYWTAHRREVHHRYDDGMGDAREVAYVTESFHTSTGRDVTLRRRDWERSSTNKRGSERDGAAKKWRFQSLRRSWISGPPSENTTTGVTFSLMSFNCLAPSLVRPNEYLYRSQMREYGRSVVDWETRRGNILRELQERSCDVLCLQEIDSDIYESGYRREIENLGYSGTYVRCTGTKVDGVAIYVKADKLQIVEARHVQFHPHKDNVGIAMILNVPTLDRKICVATTHLLFNPKRGDIKLAQIMTFMSHVKDLVDEHERSSESNIPLLFCGDLNLNPGSFLYNFIISGQADMGHARVKQMADGGRTVEMDAYQEYKDGLLSSTPPHQRTGFVQDSDAPVNMELDETDVEDSEVADVDAPWPPDDLEDTGNATWLGTSWGQIPRIRDGNTHYDSGILRHPFLFSSVYAPYYHPNSKQRYYTTFHDSNQENLDYIFYGELRHEARDRTLRFRQPSALLQCMRYLDMPLGRHARKMPNPWVPSDHIPLIVEFKLTIQPVEDHIDPLVERFPLVLDNISTTTKQ
ncbi:Endonuclease/exonuclease/phosphatase [Gaertneriomyces semiglobifer]|nr:Endonuclease/exonuclease/phosphatase [Gaertneriomyces semiglobifer]